MPGEREARRARALEAYRRQAVRAPSCAGGVYPDAPGPLRRALDRWLAPPPGPSARASSLLVAPHIDYARGAEGYARAYAALAGSCADLFVVFGTAHAGPDRLFTLTRLDYATPLGPAETDRALVDALAAAMGEDAVLGDEHHHAGEHSVELQVVLLKHLLGRPFRLLPVLCGSVSHLPDPAPLVAPFLSALAAAIRGRRALFVAGADLHHVGPLYGDRPPPGPDAIARAAREDRRTLAFVEAGDPAGFHRDAVRDDARRRLCGVAPIYAAMRAAGRGARVLHAGQWTDGVDAVGFAAAAG